MRKLRVQVGATGAGVEKILKKPSTKSATKPRTEFHAKLSKRKLGSNQR